MKLSLKILDEHDDRHRNHYSEHRQNPLLLRAKIPITVFGLPFLSGFAASDFHSSSDLSLHVSTNFPSGPSLKFSYSPTATTKASAFTTASPLAVTLKSGVSFSGSPKNSPLIISAQFSFSPHKPNPNPIFSIQLKPRLGDFSLRKNINSNPYPNPDPKSNSETNSIGFVPIDRPMIWKDLTMDSHHKDSIFSGIVMMAKTALPVTKRMALSFGWGVNIPADFGKQIPFLSVNKIKIERVEEVKEEKEKKNKGENVVGDLEIMKPMFSWMKREVDVLRKENRELQHALDEMKLGHPVRTSGCDGNRIGKTTPPTTEMPRGFEQWRSKKNGGEEDKRKEQKKIVNQGSDLESELQRAIKAASSQ